MVFGHCWPRADYPWISLWCCSRPDGYVSRGIDFGSTGLHQPFPVLLRHPTLLGEPTFAHIDAAESQTRSYAMFIGVVPSDWRGVGDLVIEGGQLRLREATPGTATDTAGAPARTCSVSLGGSPLFA